MSGDGFSVDSVDFQADQLFNGHIFHRARLQPRNIVRRDAMNAHGDERIPERGTTTKAMFPHLVRCGAESPRRLKKLERETQS